MVDGGEKDRVQGSVWVVQSEEQEELWRYYEGRMYEVVRCEIDIGRERMWGLTFRFCGGRN